MLKELISAKRTEIEQAQKARAEQLKKDLEKIWTDAINSLKETSFGDGKLTGKLNLQVERRVIDIQQALKFAKDEGLKVEINSYVNMSGVVSVDFYLYNNTIEIFGTVVSH